MYKNLTRFMASDWPAARWSLACVIIIAALDVIVPHLYNGIEMAEYCRMGTYWIPLVLGDPVYQNVDLECSLEVFTNNKTSFISSITAASTPNTGCPVWDDCDWTPCSSFNHSA